MKFERVITKRGCNKRFFPANMHHWISLQLYKQECIVILQSI